MDAPADRRQGICSLLIGGVSHVADVAERDGACVVDVDGETYAIRVEEQTRYIIRTRGGAAGARQRPDAQGARFRVRSPTSPCGRASRSRPGDTLLVIEAMKMENEFKAPAAGTVARSGCSRARR